MYRGVKDSFSKQWAVARFQSIENKVDFLKLSP